MLADSFEGFESNKQRRKAFQMGRAGRAVPEALGHARQVSAAVLQPQAQEVFLLSCMHAFPSEQKRKSYVILIFNTAQENVQYWQLEGRRSG